MLAEVVALFTSSTNAPAGCSWRLPSALLRRFVGRLFRLRLRGTCLDMREYSRVSVNCPVRKSL